MSRRIWILNLGLLALLVFGIARFRQDWKAFGPLHDVRAIRAIPTVLPSLPAAPKTAAAANANWTDIPTRDPFSFDRNDIAIVIAAPVAPPKPPGPAPILFGTLIFKGTADSTALMASGGATSRSSRPLKIGQSMDGWTLTDISERKVQMDAGGVSRTITVDDSSALVPRDYSRTTASPAPAVQGPAPAVQGPAPVQSPFLPAGTTAPHTHTEMTPFGPRVVKDPQQQ